MLFCESAPNINHIHVKMLLYFLYEFLFFTIQMSTGLHHIWCTSNSPMVILKNT